MDQTGSRDRRYAIIVWEIVIIDKGSPTG